MAPDRPTTNKTTVAELVAEFLAWMETNRKPKTREWYRNHCESFVRYVGQRLRVADVKPYHVGNWLKVHGENKSKVNVGKRKGRNTKNTRSDNSKTYLNGGSRAEARPLTGQRNAACHVVAYRRNGAPLCEAARRLLDVGPMGAVSHARKAERPVLRFCHFPLGDWRTSA